MHLGCQVIGAYWVGNKLPGTIINMSSMSALRPLSRVFTYSMTKAAVWNLTQNLAREWAPENIRVNALCPGFFPAEQNRKVLDKDVSPLLCGLRPWIVSARADELVGGDSVAGFGQGRRIHHRKPSLWSTAVFP